MNTHTGKREYKCDICGKQFDDAESRVKHRQLHQDERKHACEFCGKSFLLKKGLQSHVRMHTGEHKFACGLCPLRFLYSSSASIHRRIHQEDNNSFKCPLCGKQFNNFHMLKVHAKDEHRDSDCLFLTV